MCRILPVNGVQWQILPSSAACGRQLPPPREEEALETQKRGRFRALSDCRKRCAHPLAPSARGLRPQAVGERTVRLSEIFRAMARFSPSAPSGHRSPSGASATSPVSGESVSQREVFRHAEEDAFAPSFLFTDTHTSFSPSQQTLRCIPAPWPRRQLPQARCRPRR